jgi:hypothetical protein
MDFDDYNLSSESHAMAAEAIRHIGSQAVPFLTERLSESRLKKFKHEAQEWRSKYSPRENSSNRPIDPRHAAFAGLDALGSAAPNALPTLEKLLYENPPDPRALYVVARIGSAGVPMLTRSLTNEVRLVRLQARVCLDMMSSHSELLYPRIPVGPDTPSFDRRYVEFNLKVMHVAFQEYKKEHPNFDSPSGQFNRPLPTTLPPQMPIPVQ